jgi:putative transposase
MGVGFPLAHVVVLLSLATGACHDLAVAPYVGKGTGETTLRRRMYDTLSPGDVVLADSLFDNYFLACELRERGIELVARVQAEPVGSRTVEVRPDGEVILWQRPNKPRGMTGEQYRRYPKSLLMRQVSVDAREEGNRAGQFKVATTLLDAASSEDRPALITALLGVIAYHRVGHRPGRWEPRARKRRRKPGAYLLEPRAVTKQAKDRSKWF